MSSRAAIQVPHNAYPGMRVKAHMPDGRSIIVTIPDGAKPGMTLMVSVPPAAQGTTEPPKPEVDFVPKAKTNHEVVPTKDIKPCIGCCCYVCSIYPKCPDCCGCYSKGVFCCMETEALLCKPGGDEPKSICMCARTEIECIKPSVCCKGVTQCFCFDLRAALPCDEEVPCVIAILGLTVCKNYACVCACGQDLGPKSPEEEEMAR